MLGAQMLKLIVAVAVLALASAFRPPAHGSSWTRPALQMSSRGFEKSAMAALLGFGLTMAPIDMVRAASAAVVAGTVVPATAATAAPVGKKTTAAPVNGKTTPAPNGKKTTVEEVAIEAATLKKKEGKAKASLLSADVRAGKAKETQLKGEVKKNQQQLADIKKKLKSVSDSKLMAAWEAKQTDVKKLQMENSLALSVTSKKVSRDEAELYSLNKRLQSDDSFIASKTADLKKKQVSARLKVEQEKAQILEKRTQGAKGEKAKADGMLVKAEA
ncbi:hypothetical protein B484DRAFT_428953, partial [Ochromonadaceae sp. CCMP2298]